MSLSLQKGSNLSLSKEAPGLTIARVGLGWDARSTDGAPFDLDASAFLLTDEGHVRSDADFIFYGQLSDAVGSVVHQGDNRTGEGDGDDEQIVIDLTKVPADVQKIAVIVSIDKGEERGQSFGQVRGAYIRLVDEANGTEVTKYDLSEDAGSEIAMNFAEIYRHNGEWKMKAVGQGFASGLYGVALDYKVQGLTQ